jgi:RHS repeat-associated protein
MAKRTYNTLNGQIRSETNVSGTKYYVADALGSVTGVSQGGTISGAARYSPYGRSMTGVSGAAVGWVGAWGYYPTGRPQSSHYVRARYFDTMAARWTTTDPIWPHQPEFTYAQNSPVSFSDASGMHPGLSFVLEGPPRKGDCGRFSILGSFKLNGTRSPGWIVQQVTFRVHQVTCFPHVPQQHFNPSCPFWGESFQYFEAWYWDGTVVWGFADGVRKMYRGVGDIWLHPGQGCGSGTHSTEGLVKFFAGKDGYFSDPRQSWASRNGLVPGGVNCAGGANSAVVFPLWGTNTSSPLKRYAHTSWSCCYPCMPFDLLNNSCSTCASGKCSPTHLIYHQGF